MPAVLEQTGFPAGEVTVTSVPDLSFRMADGEKVWTVTYNPRPGAWRGSGRRPGEPLSARRFLTRLHAAHGYPGEVGARWLWAVIVDAMAVRDGVLGAVRHADVVADEGDPRWGLLVVLLVSAAAADVARGRDARACSTDR